MKLPHILAVMLISSFLNTGYAGLSLGSTRVVISDGKNEGSVNVHNKNDSNYLIQSWVVDKNEKSTEDFVLTPPLFKLNANTSNSLRVLLVGNITEEKESLYWLNVKFIPSTNKNDGKNKITFAVNNQIKIIYRPKSISNDNMLDEFKKVKIKKIGSQLELNNPTKHYISISEVLADKESLIVPSYIEPESNVMIPLNKNTNPSMIGYTFIDDLGKLNIFEVKL